MPRKDNKLRNKLIMDNMALIKKIAYRIFRSLRSTKIVETDDLIQDAILGLLEWKNLTKYRPNQTKFSSFAMQRITGGIYDGIRNLDWISRKMRERQKQGRFEPANTLSLSNVDSLPDSQAVNPMELSMQKDLRKAILEMISNLPETERRSVYERFYNDETFIKISQKIGFTEAWAHQTCEQGLNKLKHELKDRRIA